MRFPRTLARRLRPLSLAAALTLGTIARAGPPPQRTAAEMLDAEGTALMQQRRYGEACPKLAESERLQPGTGVLLRLGLCDEELGKTASAWLAFREAAARAERSEDEALRQLATKRADGVAPRVPKMIVVLPAEAERDSVTLTCDGDPVDRSAIGAEIPLDPGTHAVEAVRAGRAVFRRTFTLSARDPVTTIAVAFPTAAPAAVGASPPAAGPSPGARVARTAAIVVGGVGIAAVATGAILGLSAMSNWNRARSECRSGLSGCSQDALDLQSTVKTDATGATIGFVVGAAGLVGAALLWLTAPKPGAAAARAAIALHPVVGANRLGLALAGSF